MSRIGRLPVAVPKGVTVRLEDGVFVAHGPKGENAERIHPEMTVEIGEQEVRVVRPSEAKRRNGCLIDSAPL